MRRKSKKKLIFSILSFVVVFIALLFFLVYLPYSRIKAKANVLVASAKELKASLLANDIDLVKKNLTKVSMQYADFAKESQSVYWASFIPYVSDFKNGVEAGTYMIDAGNQAVEAIYPYADLIGMKKGKASFIERSAEDRLQTAVITLDKVLGKVDAISADISEVEKRLQTIDANRYPEKFGSTEVRAKINNIKDQFSGVSSLFVDAKPLLKKLPYIMGKDKEKTYLVLFQNESERRATGGFLTAYAIFKIKDGKMNIAKSADIYSLDNSIAVHPAAPDKILTYHKNVSQFYIRDSNLSPDFVESLKLFNSLYEKSGDKVKYDGVIALDSKVLVDMLTIFGDTEADGVRFSAKIDKRCDCPQVIYQLSDMVDRPVGYVKENRKGILGELMYALFYKAIGFSPSKYWGTLFQTMYQDMETKDILLNFTDAEVQGSVEKLNFAGRVQSAPQDYLLVTNVNFAGAKSNMFINEQYTSKSTIEGGKINREVTVEYRNPYAHSDCSLERGGLCLNATLRNWVRVYVPKGAQLVNFKGIEKKALVYNELDKTVFEGFMTVPPMGKSQITVTYTLPTSVSTSEYKLYVQKQSGTHNQKLKVTVNGASKYDGEFDKDKDIK
ncbi:DUF4012 domain-containing protein [Candidatus Roizmanbacteria bacterium]|nr:DUF4012 domain-containing protein [Candidatus Roizmanbacteria bacterium]